MYDKLFRQAVEAVILALAHRFIACELAIIVVGIIVLLSDLWRSIFGMRRE